MHVTKDGTQMDLAKQEEAAMAHTGKATADGNSWRPESWGVPIEEFSAQLAALDAALDNCTQCDTDAGAERELKALSDLIPCASTCEAHAADQVVPAGERPSLDEVIEEAQKAPQTYRASGRSGLVPNRLIGKGMPALIPLMAGLGRVAKYTGPGGSGGLVNPAVSLHDDVKAGKCDEMSMDDYEKVVDCVDRLAELWEGERTMQDTKLACNLLLDTLFENKDLLKPVLDKALGRLVRIHRAFGSYGGF